MDISISKRAAAISVGIAAALMMVALTGRASALVQTSDIADGAVTSVKIAQGTIQSDDIKNGSINSGDLGVASVRSSEIGTGQVNTSELAAGAVTGSKIATDTSIALDKTRATSATGSYQNLAGDVTYEGAAGGTSFFHAGVMGNFHGDNLTNTNAVIHAGVIGAYGVTTDDDVTGPKAGVVGSVGDDGANAGSPDAAVMALLSGDSGVVTAGAAYGVQYLNSTGGSKFTYGLDLSHAAVSPYPAVTYTTADIRLSTGVTISSGSAAPSANCAQGSIYLRTGGSGEDQVLYTCSATNTWSDADL